MLALKHDITTHRDGVALWAGDELVAVFDSMADAVRGREVAREAMRELAACLATAPGRERA